MTPCHYITDAVAALGDEYALEAVRKARWAGVLAQAGETNLAIEMAREATSLTLEPRPETRRAA